MLPDSLCPTQYQRLTNQGEPEADAQSPGTETEAKEERVKLLAVTIQVGVWKDFRNSGLVSHTPACHPTCSQLFSSISWFRGGELFLVLVLRKNN